MVRYAYSLLLYGVRALIPLLFSGGMKSKQWRAGQKRWKADLQGFQREASKKIVWFHCASVGEFEQAKPVITAIRSKDTHIVVTFFSPSGFQAKKDDSTLDLVTYLPLDTPTNVRVFLDLLKPDVAVFVKYELWFNFMHHLKKRKVPMTLISAHFIHKHWTTQWPGIHLGTQLADFDRIFAQSEVTCSRLGSVGVFNCEVAGDTRVDQVVQIANEPFKNEALEAFVRDHPVLVVGSNWPEDDAHLIPVLRRYKDCKVIVVPHELGDRQLSYWKEECQRGLQTIDELESSPKDETRVVYINRMGLLSKVYRYASVAYIGGGFGKAVHNTLEAMVYGIPVIFGPRNDRFLEVQRLKELGIGQQVKDDDELEDALRRAMEDMSYRASVRTKGQAFIQSQQGATESIVAWITEKLVDR